jgi:hypothetical protein
VVRASSEKSLRIRVGLRRVAGGGREDQELAGLADVRAFPFDLEPLARLHLGGRDPAGGVGRRGVPALAQDDGEQEAGLDDDADGQGDHHDRVRPVLHAAPGACGHSARTSHPTVMEMNVNVSAAAGIQRA